MVSHIVLKSNSISINQNIIKNIEKNIKNILTHIVTITTTLKKNYIENGKETDCELILPLG